MLKGFVTAVLLAACAAGCADEPQQPPVLQPTSHHNLPLPPVKPDLPRGGVQQSAFTNW